MNPDRILPHTRFPNHLLSRENLIDERVGKHDYDIVIGLMTRFRQHVIVRQLAAHFPEDFLEAAEHLNRVGYHVLRTAEHYGVYALANPCFDVAEVISLMLERDEVVDRIHSSEIAGSVDVDDAIAEITAAMQAMSADSAKAVWASLVFSQNAELSEFDLLAAPWWSAEYIVGTPSMS